MLDISQRLTSQWTASDTSLPFINLITILSNTHFVQTLISARILCKWTCWIKMGWRSKGHFKTLPPKPCRTFYFSLVLHTLNHEQIWVFTWISIFPVGYTLIDLILVTCTPLYTSIPYFVGMCLLLLGRFLTAWVIGSGCINWCTEAADTDLSQPHSQGYKRCCLARGHCINGHYGLACSTSGLCSSSQSLGLRQGTHRRLWQRERCCPFFRWKIEFK